MVSCRVDQKHTLTEHFKQVAVINVYANSGVMPQKHGIILVIIELGKCVLGRLFVSGTSDFGMVERISATIFGESDTVFPTALRAFISDSRYTVAEKRRVKFAVCSAVVNSVYTFIKMYIMNG